MLKKFVLFFTCVSLHSFAAVSDLQEWSLFIFQGPKAEKLRAYFEVQPRFGSDLSKMYTIMVRPAAQYHLTENSSVWLGYAWTPTFDPIFKDEQRLWQQYQFTLPMPSMSFSARTRFEERWIGGVPSTAFRLRQWVRLQIPLTKGETDWNFVTWDEIFFHLNSPTASIQTGYNQNRIFAGLSRTFYPSIRCEAGYLLNHVHREAQPDLINHVILTAFYVSF